MALRAVQEALAEEPARAERDLRLQDVIAGAERIVLGVEKGVDAVALVFPHMAPDQRQRAACRGDDEAEFPQPDAGEEEHRAAAHQQHQRGAEIGLLQHQYRRRQDEERRHDEAQRATDILDRQPVKIARQRQDQRDLHQLRRLQLDEAEIDPALCPHADRAAHLDGDEQGEGDGEDDVGAAQPEADIDQGDTDHQADGNGKAHHLARRPGLHIAIGRRIEHGEAEAGDRREQQQQPPIEAPQLLREGQPRRPRIEPGHRCQRHRRRLSRNATRRRDRHRGGRRTRHREPGAPDRAAAPRARDHGRSAPPPPSRRPPIRRHARR